MTAEKEPKLAAAVTLGRRGGKQTAKLHPTQFSDMGKLAHKTKMKRYPGFYTLIPFGHHPKDMTEKQREEALAKIEANRNRRRKRKTQ